MLVVRARVCGVEMDTRSPVLNTRHVRRRNKVNNGTRHSRKLILYRFGDDDDDDHTKCLTPLAAATDVVEIFAATDTFTPAAYHCLSRVIPPSK